jgi:hypothetical protein
VYVIELEPAVLAHARFRAANPHHDPKKPPLDVGMTGLAQPLEKVLARELRNDGYAVWQK